MNWTGLDNKKSVKDQIPVGTFFREFQKDARFDEQAIAIVAPCIAKWGSLKGRYSEGNHMGFQGRAHIPDVN